MKTEFEDVNETRKTVRVEIPSDAVDAEIDRIARDYSRKARVPGFRPGKTPPRVIKQRFKDQILHDVAHDLIPRAVDDALREKGLEAVDTPDVREVTIEEGQPLTFTASFDTVPEFDPGDLATIAFKRASNAINDEAVQMALQRLRDRGARHEPVEGRGVDHGDTVTLDLERRDAERRARRPQRRQHRARRQGEPARVRRAAARPRGRRAQGIHAPLPGRLPDWGARQHRRLVYSDGQGAQAPRPAGARRRVREGSRRRLARRAHGAGARGSRARGEARGRARGSLRAHEAARDAAVPFDVPASMVDREVDRRLEDFARRLIDQNVDPRQAGIDWNAFRESQREVVARGGRGRAGARRSDAAREARGHRRRGRGRGREIRGTDRPDAGRGARGARERRRIVPYLCGVTAGEVD